jgi:hypothetical protein
MPVFKASGREWKVTLDAPTIRELRQELELDFGAVDGKVFERLDADPCLLVDALWVICRGQANGMSDADFGRGLVGDSIGDAAKALTDAWLDFFPQGKRSLLRSLSDKQAALTDKATAMAMAKINDPTLETKLLEAAEARMTKELENTLTRLNGATNSPESAASELKVEP